MLRCGSRDAQGETTLLIKVMNFNFGDIDVMETRFEEFNLLIKEHDDISGIDIVPDTIKRAILVALLPLRTHLHLNRQSYTTFLEMSQAINQDLKVRKGFKLMERDDPMDVDFLHKECQKSKGKGNDKGKEKSNGKSKGKGKQNEFWERQVESRKVPRYMQKLWARQDTNRVHVGAKGGGAAKKPNSVGETEKTGDVTLEHDAAEVGYWPNQHKSLEAWRCSGTSVSCTSAHESQVFIHAEVRLSHCAARNPF